VASSVISTLDLVVDNTIQQDSSGAIYADNGIIRADFIEAGNTVRFTSKGRTITWTPQNMRYVDSAGMEDVIYQVQDVPLEAKANYARFNRTMPDVDDWFIVEADRLKHQIIVQGFQRDPAPYLSEPIQFAIGGQLTFDSDLTVRSMGMTITGAFQTSDAIQICDGDEVIFTLPGIVAYDSKIPERAQTTGFYNVTVNEPGNLAFDIVVDNAWMADVERVYPVIIDPTIVSTTSIRPFNPSSQKRMDRAPNGNLWLMVQDSATNAAKFYVSKDGGTTWTYANTSDVANVKNGSFFIDVDGYAHLAYYNNSNNNIEYVRGTPNGTGDQWTWSTPRTVVTNQQAGNPLNWKYNYPDIVAFKLGSIYYAIVTWTKYYYDNNVHPGYHRYWIGCYYNVVTIDGAGNITIPAFPGESVNYVWDYYTYYEVSGSTGGSHGYAMVHFNHTGDGKTVKNGVADLYVVWANTKGDINCTQVIKGTFNASGPSWSFSGGVLNTRLQMSSYSPDGHWSSYFDGQRVVVAMRNLGTSTAITVYEIDVTTGNFVDYFNGGNSSGGFDPGDGNVMGVAVAYDHSNKNIWLAFQCATSGLTKWRKYDRLAQTWSAVSTLSSVKGGVLDYAVVATMVDSSDFYLPVVGVENTASPYNLVAYKVSTNNAPSAPTNLSNTSFDATTNQTLTYTFVDQDQGDVQTSRRIQIVDASNGGIVVDTGKVGTSSQSYTIPANTLQNGKTYQWRVMTWDSRDQASPWSNYATFFTSAKPTATITSPANDTDTLPSSSVTCGWVFSDPEGGQQSAYQLKLTDANDVVVWDSGKVSDSTTRSLRVPVTLANNTTYKLKLTLWDDKDVAGDEKVRLVNVYYTPPATPTITATGQGTHIHLAITNPPPSGTQPTVAYNDLYRRKVGETNWTRIATNIPTNGTYDDYAVASGQAYEYKVTAIGSNDTATDSATATASITLSGVWLHDPLDPAGTIHNFRLRERNRSVQTNYTQTMMQFEGRSLPVADIAGQMTQQVQVTISCPSGSGDLDALYSLIGRQATLCYRDQRGRRIFGVVSAIPETEEWWGSSVQLTVQAVDYMEVV
jgi:hypothetical protein